MKITNLCITRISGIFTPINGLTTLLDKDEESIEADFVCVQSDSGETGIWGPINQIQSYLLLFCIRPHVIGLPAFAIERVWSEVFRLERHGRSGHYITALSALDLALWDLVGQYQKKPVFELLGGPIRTQVPVYASMLGFDPDAENAPSLAEAIRSEGYSGQKWALRDGPSERSDGLYRNLRRVTRLREAVGEDHQLMVDAFGRWDLSYAQEFCRRAEHLRLTWVEEPLPPEMLLSYKRLRSATSTALAAGEHCYTRFEIANLLEANVVDFIQPDAGWCGGLTELRRIITLASVYGVPIVPHGGGLIPSLHLAASDPIPVIPKIEYHLTVEPKRQWFLRSSIKLDRGRITVPVDPGLGFEIDESRVKERRDLYTIQSL